MTKRFLGIFSAVLAVAVLSAAMVLSVSAEYRSAERNNPSVKTVAHSQAAPEASRVLESRFLNMLNHNFAYGEDFSFEEDLVNASALALLNMRESEDSSYIAEGIVADYIFDMYGVEIKDFSSFNASFPQKSGYVYIIPRGYSEYSNKIASVSENEDGSFTVITEVEVATHDNGTESILCETLFVKNESSRFGFSIISSDFVNSASAV